MYLGDSMQKATLQVHAVLSIKLSDAAMNLKELPSDIHSAVKPLYVVSRIFGLAPYIYSRTTSSGTAAEERRRFQSTLCSTIQTLATLILLLVWFICCITWNIVYKYPGMSKNYTIPDFCRSCLLFGATLSALVISNRPAAVQIFLKVDLVDRILLAQDAAQVHRKTNIILITELVAVLCVLSAIFVISWDSAQPHVISIGYLLAQGVNALVVIQFVDLMLLLKHRFGRLNTQLSTNIVQQFEEDSLNTYLNASTTHLQAPSSAELKPYITVQPQTPPKFEYDITQIHNLRMTHSILYEVSRMINANFGLQILLDLTYDFISLVLFMYLAMNNTGDMVYVSFVKALSYAFRIVMMSVSCNLASQEMANTAAVVQRLLLPRPLPAEALKELELFSQQLGSADIGFTAAGFFTINLGLLCSAAQVATTYVVILLQMPSELQT